MTRILTLDQSETSTGFAVWGEGDARALVGSKRLGTEYTSAGRVFANVHALMSDLHSIGPIDVVYYERPRHLDGWNAQSNANAHFLLVGLAAHIASWGEAMQCRIVRDVHMATWRRSFLGKMPRATKSAELKSLAVQRAKELGYKTQCHDEAEAFGILDHACSELGLDAPWQTPLQRAIAKARA